MNEDNMIDKVDEADEVDTRREIQRELDTAQNLLDQVQAEWRALVGQLDPVLHPQETDTQRNQPPLQCETDLGKGVEGLNVELFMLRENIGAVVDRLGV